MNQDNIKPNEDLLNKSGYIDNDNWNSYTFLGKLLLIFGIVCLICFIIIIISFTIIVVKLWI